MQKNEWRYGHSIGENILYRKKPICQMVLFIEISTTWKIYGLKTYNTVLSQYGDL